MVMMMITTTLMMMMTIMMVIMMMRLTADDVDYDDDADIQDNEAKAQLRNGLPVHDRNHP